VGYFFGRDLQRVLKVPVGMIDASRGGTPAEAWISDEVLEADPDLKLVADSWRQRIADFPQALEMFKQKLGEWEKSAGEAEASGKAVPPMPVPPQDPRSHRWRDAGLWNGMIAPLTSYAIAGTIWYQGESNTDSPYQYRKVFAELIRDWRRTWGEGDFPFLFVQLASFTAEGGPPDSWAVLRESQEKALALPKTGMVVAIDIGDSHDIHPKNKQEVGRRLALVAEGVAYGRKLEYRGPAFQLLRVEKGTLHVQFGHLGGGLVARGGPLVGFQIAGQDQKFYPAEAIIAGNEVVLSSPRVKEPEAARYAWANDPKCNLYNRAGLPAPPFRTDAWTVTAQGEIRKEAPPMW
jgi:sialate O-acetylesterase